MTNSLYYGEIVAKISCHLYQNPEHKAQISQVINTENDTDNTIWTLCADAAKVFDAIEDLSGEHFIDWNDALDHYADQVLEHLLDGRAPNIIDLISIASASVQQAV